MTDGFFQCDRCGTFVSEEMPHLNVIQDMGRGAPPPSLREGWYCSACAPKVYNQYANSIQTYSLKQISAKNETGEDLDITFVSDDKEVVITIRRKKE